MRVHGSLVLILVVATGHALGAGRESSSSGKAPLQTVPQYARARTLFSKRIPAWGGFPWFETWRRARSEKKLIARSPGGWTRGKVPMHRGCLLASFLGAMALSGATVVAQPHVATASLIDPRPPPSSSRRPFFEGWCIRLVDHQRRVSFAVIIGSFRSRGAQDPELDQHYVSVSYMNPEGKRSGRAWGEKRNGKRSGDISGMPGNESGADDAKEDGRPSGRGDVQSGEFGGPTSSSYDGVGVSALLHATEWRGGQEEKGFNCGLGQQQTFSEAACCCNKDDNLHGNGDLHTQLGGGSSTVRSIAGECTEGGAERTKWVGVMPWREGQDSQAQASSTRVTGEAHSQWRGEGGSIQEDSGARGRGWQWTGNAIGPDESWVHDWGAEHRSQRSDHLSSQVEEWGLDQDKRGPPGVSASVESEGEASRISSEAGKNGGHGQGKGDGEGDGEGSGGADAVPPQLARPPYSPPTCAERVHTYHAFPPPDTVTISVGGTSVRQAPDMHADADFTWEADGLGSLMVSGDEGRLSFELPEVSVAASFRRRVPWSHRHPNSAGPEGWLSHTPLLPCHYFVYSLGSEAGYSLKPQGSPRAIVGRGSLHLEINYGETFPSAWVWAQGCSSTTGLEGKTYQDGEVIRPGELPAQGDTRRTEAGGGVKAEGGEQPLARFVLTGGRFKIGPKATNSFVIGYRSQKLSWDFRTTDLDLIDASVSCSSGRLKLFAKSWKGDRVLEADIRAPVESFGPPIYVPTAHGFDNVPGCIESYCATASFRLYTRTGGKGTPLRLEEEVEVKVSALEFGGDFQFT